MRLGDWLFAAALLLALITRRRSRYLRGELLLGLGFGALWERLFSDFWTYSSGEFAVFAAPNLPLAMPAYWATFLLGGMAISDALSRTRWSRAIAGDGPWREIPWDVCAFSALGIALETVGVRTGLWRYEAGLLLGTIPLFGVPVFAALGYVSIGALVPTSVRFWRRHLCPT